MVAAASPVKIACIQMDIVEGNKNANLEKAEKLIREACGNGAGLIVLPETFNSGFFMDCRRQAFQIAEAVPEGGSTQMLIRLAREFSVYICASLLERVGSDVFNAGVLVGPDGYIGKYRKLHPCEDEVYFAEPGDLGIPVFHTPIGRIGLCVCLDAYYPEVFRILALQGADIVCCMFNSSDVQETRHLPEPIHTLVPALCMANAVSNHIFTVCCDRVGRGHASIHGNKYAGQSAIISPWGGPISEIASDEEEVILYADVDLCDARRKNYHPTNSRLAVRRTDVYSADLGYDPGKYPRQ